MFNSLEREREEREKERKERKRGKRGREEREKERRQKERKRKGSHLEQGSEVMRKQSHTTLLQTRRDREIDMSHNITHTM